MYRALAVPNRRIRRSWTMLLFASAATCAAGAEPSLRIFPAQTVLRGPDSVQQLAVEGSAADQAVLNLSGRAEFVSSDPKVATVDPSGLIEARGDGKAIVTVRAGKLEAQVPVTVQEFAAGVVRSRSSPTRSLPVLHQAGL